MSMNVIAERGIERWSNRCQRSMDRGKREVEKKYGIRIGQTDLYCIRCGKSCFPGRHVCEDMRLENLHQARKAKAEEKIIIVNRVKADKEMAKAQNPLLCTKIKEIGRKKAAIKLGLPENTVNGWIKREKVPFKHIHKVMEL
jgi:hypothetical protein